MYLPEILVTVSGESISTVEDWETFRKPEILGLFSQNVYGVRPMERPEDLAFQEEKRQGGFLDGLATYIKTRICFHNYSFPVQLFLPKNSIGPVPAFVYIMLSNQSKRYDLEKDANPEVVPLTNIVSRGYAVAVFSVDDVDPDRYDGFQDGIHGALQPPALRTSASWGTISAWAWGASRVLDYLETVPEVDSGHVGIVGHSRGGKTALWCGATDTRFRMVVSNDSGCTGAAVSRKKDGETVKAINEAFPHWFCENYKKYGENEDMLPVDQHMLLALIAPRALYVSSASEDDWACPRNELLSCRTAGEVYELYGLDGLILPKPRTTNTSYQSGQIAYHCRAGEHAITQLDWSKFLDFADKHLKSND